MGRRLKRMLLVGVPQGQGGAAPFGDGAAVYGVSWDGSATSTLTRTDDAVGMVAAAGVDSATVTNDFDAADIYKDITEVTDAFGNVFVRIPKFYIRKTKNGAARTWQITQGAKGDGYLPWCFWDHTNEVELDYVDVGKYPAGLDGSNRLTSKVGEYPLINKNIVEFRGYAAANGTGYHQLDIHVADLLQVLFYVEFATLDSQSIMAGYTSGRYTNQDLATVTEAGANRIIVANATAAPYEVGQAISVGTSQGGNQIFYGRTITAKTVYDGSNTAIAFDGAPVNITTGNYLYNTGYKNGDAVTATSGSVSSNSSGKHYCKYRGVISPWGNVWQFVDGVNINDWQAWVATDPADYASNLFAAPYQQLGYANSNANGYASEMGHDPALPFAELPIAVAGGSSSYYADYYYQSAGQRIAVLGAGWYNGSAAGLSHWSLPGSSSSSALNIGGRLVRKPTA